MKVKKDINRGTSFQVPKILDGWLRNIIIEQRKDLVRKLEKITHDTKIFSTYGSRTVESFTLYTNLTPLNKKNDDSDSLISNIHQAYLKKHGIKEDRSIHERGESLRIRQLIVELRDEFLVAGELNDFEQALGLGNRYISFDTYVNDLISKLQEELCILEKPQPFVLKLDKRLRSRRILRDLFKSLDGEGESIIGSTFSYNIHKIKIKWNSRSTAY